MLKVTFVWYITVPSFSNPHWKTCSPCLSNFVENKIHPFPERLQLLPTMGLFEGLIRQKSTPLLEIITSCPHVSFRWNITLTLLPIKPAMYFASILRPLRKIQQHVLRGWNTCSFCCLKLVQFHLKKNLIFFYEKVINWIQILQANTYNFPDKK